MAAPREQARGRPGAAAHGPRDVRLHAGRGFAERARRELLATGETVRNRMSGTRDELTAWERQIAWRARDGRSNSEIGAKLFLSPRTVEWHLRKVLTKLGISSAPNCVRRCLLRPHDPADLNRHRPFRLAASMAGAES